MPSGPNFRLPIEWLSPSDGMQSESFAVIEPLPPADVRLGMPVTLNVVLDGTLFTT